MKKFLLKILIFLSVPAIFWTSCMLIYFVRVRTISFDLPEDKTILFCGTSHFETGIDENLIPHSFNFSASGDPALYQYLRIKKILDGNAQIKTIFVAFDPLVLSPVTEDCLWRNDRKFKKHFPLFGENEWKVYWKNSPKKTINFLLQTPKDLINSLSNSLKESKAISNLAGQIPYSQNTKQGLGQKAFDHAKFHFLEMKDCKTKTFENQKKYLRKIADLAHSKNVRLIFLETPIYHASNYWDLKKFEELRESEFSDVEYWNYRDLPIPDDYRRDVNHLNRWGAEIFSRELAEHMQKEGIL